MHKLHSFVPLSLSTLEVRDNSKSDRTVTVTIKANAKGIDPNSICGYMTKVYDGKWCVGYVMQVKLDVQEVTVYFLHSHGPIKYFRFPQHADIFTVHFDCSGP